MNEKSVFLELIEPPTYREVLDFIHDSGGRISHDFPSSQYFGHTVAYIASVPHHTIKQLETHPKIARLHHDDVSENVINTYNLHDIRTAALFWNIYRQVGDY